MIVTPRSDREPAQALNLMETGLSGRRRRTTADAAWFAQARFGMFVHYGLYSIHGRGEWSMYFDRIPREEYNRLADEFRADRFDADALADLARRAGAGYVVMGARHHDGFCLWDTRTTAFNSARTAAGRDLILEYVDACRRAGLRVGIYYSVMSWQWPAIFSGPEKDPEGWKAMVRETHEQVRELVSNYGKIDLIWYDGCVVPGLGDPVIRAKRWRSRELNAMVRRFQPGILINDRAALPEDITTPEQHLTPAPRGRLWECCQTIGDRWGWYREDWNLKSSRELIQQLIFCARHGGNFLLNIGPKADGTVPEGQVRVMEAIGRWLAVHGESIRGSERTSYTEGQHILGQATCRGSTVYFHLSEWPESPARIAGIKAPIESVRLLGSGTDLNFEQYADGTAIIRGLPGLEPIEEMEVVAMKLARPPSRKAPPSLLVERDTGRHEPAEAAVCAVDGWNMARSQRLAFVAPASGAYRLDLGVIGEKASSLAVTLDAKPFPKSLRLECGNYPAALRLENLRLEEGKHDLELHSRKAAFGLYLWRLQPIWKVLGPGHWWTIGPFPTAFGPQGTNDEVREALQTEFAPERIFEPAASVRRADGQEIQWRMRSMPGEKVSFARLLATPEVGVCYAATTVVSPEERDLDVLLACDWWANLFVNGKRVRSQRDPEGFKQDGAWFNGWKPIPARVRLKKGKNILSVKCHPGSTDNWFTFYANDAGDLKFAL